MSEKRFEATHKRLEKARKDGQTAKAPFLTQAIVITALLSVLYYVFTLIWVDFQNMVEYQLFQGYREPREALSQMSFYVVKVVGSCLMVAGVLAIVSEGLQVGFRVESKPLVPQFSRISPIKGFTNIISNFKRTSVKLFSVICILIFSFFLIKQLILAFPVIVSLSFAAKFEFFRGALHKLFYITVISFFISAGIEVFLNRRKFKKETMMSLEELKDENKESEGDPQMKSARMAAHMALLREEIVQRVKRSKVIVVKEYKEGGAP